MFEFGFNFIGKCSKGSKFDPLMFVQFEVRFFDVRSKTNENLTYSLKVYLAVVLLTYNKQQCSELECKNVLLDIYIISHRVP